MASITEDSEVSIRRLQAADTYPIRSQVLRDGKPAEFCVFDGDLEPETRHWGAFVHERLVGICSLIRRSSPLEPLAQPSVQLRGMAVLPDLRSLGLGARLLMHSEQYLRENEVFLLWMNARLNAVEFYRRNGYRKKGTMFEVKGIGPHYYMYKYLSDEAQDVR